MSELVSLRPQSASDGEFLAALYASTRSQELALVPWSEAQKQAFLRMQFAAQTRHYDGQFPQATRTIILCDGVAVGRLYLDRRADEIRVIDIALLPGHRGRGIGRGLLSTVLDDARASGLAVRIHVERDNPAQRLYRRLGFQAVQVNGIYLLMEWRSQAAEQDDRCSSN